MTLHTDRSSQHYAAKVFGLIYLPTFVLLAVANFGMLQPLIESTAAQNILAHATLFRVGVLGYVLYGMSTLVMSAALYVILRPAGQNLALLALFGRMANGFIWLIIALNLLSALRLLSQPESTGLPLETQQYMARLYLSGFDQYYVGLLFWSLGAAIGAYLWFKSGHVPRALAISGILAGVWGAACTIALLVFPGFQNTVNLWLFDTPLVLFEISLSILVLFRGLRG